jgi:arylsulfatase A-like enzyme
LIVARPFASPLPRVALPVLVLLFLLTAACARRDRAGEPLAADLPLHLDEHLAAARIEGSSVPKDLPAAVEWRFDRPRPEWKPVVPLLPRVQPATVTRAGDALRITLGEANRHRRGLRGGVYVDLPGWERQDWAFLVVRARSSGKIGNLTAWSNLRPRPGEMFYEYEPFLVHGEAVHVVGDGAVHSYLLRADWSDIEEGSGSWRQLGLMIDAPEPASLDVLSVSLVPKEARYARSAVGVLTEPRAAVYRRAVYVHAPGKLAFRVRVPPAGRLDFGLGVLRGDAPVSFRVTASSGSQAGSARTLFAETWSNREAWGQRSVDLSPWAGQVVTLALAASAGRPGTVALWAAPTVSGTRSTSRPNVILYVIDAGGARYMSAYGYNRRTTPNLERLAGEGALFENAHSNSTWSKPSTTSFMTSLHHSVLGGYRTATDPLPDQAETMAQRLHRAGFQTAVFTSNTWCGTMSSLDRGVDVLRETIAGPNSASSGELQKDFWRWREANPGEPYWVHFQTTDVHWPWQPVAPVGGVFLSHAEREAFADMERRLGAAAGLGGRFWGLRASLAQFAKAGIDRGAYFDAVRGIFDEAMAYTDSQLGRLVEQLKARGEWEHTLLIVTADHGDWPGLGYFEAGDPAARIPYLNPYLTQVPLVVTWPGHIAPGRRLSEPVSLIDLLPTVLDLTAEERPAVLQGQSLAPLLLERPGWRPRPVLLDEFNVDPATGRWSGAIEMIDGRWGASLRIGEGEGGPPLLLYDLWNDPFCRQSLHRERPDLVTKYTGLLERQFRENRALAKRFTRSGEGTLNTAQIEALKSLGYIR